MRTEIKIEKCGKPFCVIHAETETSGITAVAEKIRRMDETGRMTVISGWDGDYCIQVRQGDIFRIYSMNKKVYVETEKIPVFFQGDKIITDIANFSKVTALDMSITGVVRINFTDGKTAIVSRRYMTKIKSQLNMVHKQE